MWRAARAAAVATRAMTRATNRRMHNAHIARQVQTAQVHADPTSASQHPTATSAARASPPRSSAAPADLDDDDPDSAPSVSPSSAAGSKKKQKKSSLRSLGVGGAIPGWEVVVGIEVHAQIVAASKLFSGASTRFGAAPNAHASAVDAAMPGMLPALNAHAVAQAVRTGLGLGGSIQRYSAFERKHYFYCDMPQGYQITQQSHPIVRGGGIQLDSGAVVRIARVQIEQDSGKNIHDLHPTRSYVDLNRAGVGLMEIVSEPDMRSAAEAADYIRKLTAILQQVGTCRAHMEDGSLRCDVNVSVKRVPTDAATAASTPSSAFLPSDRSSDLLSSFGERVEVKNLNSLRSLQRAIDHEFHRQVSLASAGQAVRRETRGFDAKTGSTVLMRSKEQMLDYRFAPEPDLPPLILSAAALRAIEDSMPELPSALSARFQSEYGLNAYDTGVLLSEPGAASFLDRMVFGPAGRVVANRGDARASNPMLRKPKLCANWLANELFGRIKKQRESAQAAAAAAGVELAEPASPEADSAGSFSGAGSRGATMASSSLSITPETLGALVDLLDSGRISGKSGKQLLDRLLVPGESRTPGQIARDERMELDQSGASGELLESTVSAIVASHPQQILEAHAGNKRVFGYLSGQVLKLAGKQGQVSPAAASKRLMERINEEVEKQKQAAAAGAATKS